MAFERKNLAPVVTDGENNFYVYTTTDEEIDVLTPDYFKSARTILTVGTMIMMHTKNNIEIAGVVGLDPLQLSTSERIAIDTPLAANSQITKAEIETGLTSVGVILPLTISMTVYFYDSTDTRDKVFLCRYSLATDTWYYEKMNPAPDTQFTIAAEFNNSFIGQVQANNKISRAEIEATIQAAGFALPISNVTIFINDFNDANKQFLCRYDKVQDEWYYEKLNRAN